MPKHTSQQTNEAANSGMTTLEFLAMLRQRQVRIEAREGRLKISAPAGAIDERLRTELKGRKPALLEALNTAAPESFSELVRLTAAESQGRVPLTPAQEGMWLIDHFNPGDVAYNIPEAFRFEERIELETLQSAVDRLVERHSILRVSFHEDDGELFQSIAASVAVRVGFTDMSLLDAEERERSCREAIRSEGRRAFDLKQAPLVRFHLFRLAEQQHVIFLNIHHIISDRRSLYVLREELIALIRSAERGSDAALPAMHLQFADYSAWTARQRQGEAVERQVSYWKRKLAGLPASLRLPHRLPWPAKRSALGTTRQVFVSAEVRAALNRIGTQEGASSFMTFLTVFAITLARWSREGEAGCAVDFCIGSPITHRKHPATERMVGLFVNMLAFRCQIGPGMSFRDALRQVRSTALEAYENSDVPFRRLVREINQDRSSQRSPIFQVMFGYETYQAPVANEFQMDTDPGTARYELSLHLSETEHKGLTGAIEYGSDLFADAEIDRFIAVSGACIGELIRDPEEDVFLPGAFPQQTANQQAADQQAADQQTASQQTGTSSVAKSFGAGNGVTASSGDGVLKKIARRMFSL